MKGYREFILRGNVVDLAVAVVIGAAFGAIITAFVKDLLTPLIAAIGGQSDFSTVYFTINHSQFKIGDFINTIISFLIIATAIYFLVLLPVNKLMAHFKPQPPTLETTHDCPYCLSKVPLKATRCAFCTSQLAEG